jgi:Protein of unknown function with HXXEE motif
MQCYFTISCEETGMSGSGLDSYRRNWPRLGAVLGMAIAGGTALAGRGKINNLRALSAMNFVALLVHQYEEYQDPGYFPGQFNRGVLKSSQPRNYPLNTHTAMCINAGVGYPFYALPIIFPKVKWLGIAPVLFGMNQAVGHGLLFPALSRSKYSPGFLASVFLHVPIGLAYLTALKKQGTISRSDWRKGIGYTVAIAVFGLAMPNYVGRDKNSPYAFTEAQMGRFDHDAVTAH